MNKIIQFRDNIKREVKQKISKEMILKEA